MPKVTRYTNRQPARPNLVQNARTLGAKVHTLSRVAHGTKKDPELLARLEALEAEQRAQNPHADCEEMLEIAYSASAPLLSRLTIENDVDERAAIQAEFIAQLPADFDRAFAICSLKAGTSEGVQMRQKVLPFFADLPCDSEAARRFPYVTHSALAYQEALRRKPGDPLRLRTFAGQVGGDYDGLPVQDWLTKPGSEMRKRHSEKK